VTASTDPFQPTLCPFCHKPPVEGCRDARADLVGILESGNICPQGYERVLSLRSGRDIRIACDYWPFPPRFEEARMSQAAVGGGLRAWQAEARTRVKPWMQTHGDPVHHAGDAQPNLVIYGPTGVGKSWFAAAMGNFLKSRGRSVCFVEISRLLEYRRGLFGKSQLEDLHDEPAMRAVFESDFMIFDNLGAERTTSDFVRDTIWAVVNHRYSHRRSMITTTQFESSHWDGDENWEAIARRLATDAMILRADEGRKANV